MTYVLAVVLCVASSVAYAAGALLQRHIAARPVNELAREPQWWYAVLLNAVGAALHVAALRFGPLLLVQPFGLLTLVLAVPFGNRGRITDWRGLGLTTAGLVGLLLLIDGSATDTIAAVELPALLAVVATVVIALTLVGRSASVVGRSAANLWTAAAAGVSFGVSSALAQTVTVDFGFTASTLVAAAAMGVLATAGTLLTHVAYRRQFGAALATSTLANPLAAVTIGVVLLGEGLRGGVLGSLLGAACAVLAARGIAQLATADEATRAALPAPRAATDEPLAAHRP